MMNDSTRVIRRPRRAGPPAARTAAALIATAALALLAAACSSGSPSSAGSGGSPNAGGSANSPSAVGYSHCMRSNGVPNFPDPGPGGTLPKGDAQHFGVSSSQFNAAQRACQHLLPNTGGSLQQQAQQCYEAGVCPRAVVQRILNAGRRFAGCMRSHGVNWPDPTTDSEGRPGFAISISKDGFDPHSPRIIAKVNECDHLMPGGGVPLGVSP